MATTPQTAYPCLNGPLQVDIAVIGGGITGLTTALLLLQQGASVAVVEADRIAASTTGYTTANLSSLHGLTYASFARHHGEEHAGRYGEANEAAIRKVFELCKHNGIRCDLEPMPAYTYALDRKLLGEIEQEVEVAQRLGLPASFTTRTDLPFQIAAAVRFDHQAMFHPRKYCLGLADVIVKEGGHLLEQTPALEIRADGTSTSVKTPKGSIRADHAVQATQMPFHDPFGFFTANFPSHSYGIAVPTEDRQPGGMYLSADTPTRSIRPYSDGQQNYVIVGGEGHRVGKHNATRQRYDVLQRWANSYFGPAKAAFRWSAHDYVSADGRPYIGRLTPESDRLWVATGFKKWGLTNGTVAAMILSDRIGGRQNMWAKTFDSTRLEPKSSTKKLLSRQAELAQRSAEHRIVAVSVPEANNLARGEGRVFASGESKVVAYRDDQGELHAASGVCTHMGCEVAFNGADKTWDCPCHGSRFDTHGGVIHGPATNDLEPVCLLGIVAEQRKDS